MAESVGGVVDTSGEFGGDGLDVWDGRSEMVGMVGNFQSWTTVPGFRLLKRPDPCQAFFGS